MYKQRIKICLNLDGQKDNTLYDLDDLYEPKDCMGKKGNHGTPTL